MSAYNRTILATAEDIAVSYVPERTTRGSLYPCLGYGTLIKTETAAGRAMATRPTGRTNRSPKERY